MSIVLRNKKYCIWIVYLNNSQQISISCLYLSWNFIELQKFLTRLFNGTFTLPHFISRIQKKKNVQQLAVKSEPYPIDRFRIDIVMWQNAALLRFVLSPTTLTLKVGSVKSVRENSRLDLARNQIVTDFSPKKSHKQSRFFPSIFQFPPSIFYIQSFSNYPYHWQFATVNSNTFCQMKKKRCEKMYV